MLEDADGLIRASPWFQGWGEHYILETSIRAGAWGGKAVGRRGTGTAREERKRTRTGMELTPLRALRPMGLHSGFLLFFTAQTLSDPNKNKIQESGL